MSRPSAESIVAKKRCAVHLQAGGVRRYDIAIHDVMNAFSAED
jgi:hypothetical protein